MPKKISKYAQVAKLLKQKGKELGLTLSAKSQSFAGGNSVDVDVSKGSDQAIKDLNDYSKQFVYGKFDCMTDYYVITNYNVNTPQTKNLSISDERASTILQGLGKEYWDNSYRINGMEYSWYQFANKAKEIFPNDAWQDVLQALVQEQGKFPFGGKGYLFETKLRQEEVA